MDNSSIRFLEKIDNYLVQLMDILSCIYSYLNITTVFFGVMLLLIIMSMKAGRIKIFCQLTLQNSYLISKSEFRNAFYPPTAYLFTGQLQTLACAFSMLFRHKHRKDKIRFLRELVDLEDGGCISLDWAIGEKNTLGEEKSIIGLLPGVTGDSSDLYIHNTLRQAMNAGFKCVVINYRGLGGTPLKVTSTFIIYNCFL